MNHGKPTIGPKVPEETYQLGHCWATTSCRNPQALEVITTYAGHSYASPVCVEDGQSFLQRMLAGDPQIIALRPLTPEGGHA